jgi:hypothetical protein
MKYGFILLAVMTISGCGGGGSQNSVGTTATSVTGKVIDGYISGATVYWDCNKNNALDIGEISTTTSAGGIYTIENKSTDGCSLLADILSTSIDEDQPHKVGQAYTLKASPGNLNFITPFSTLIAGKLDTVTGLTADQAEADLAKIIGIDTKLLTDYKNPLVTSNSKAMGIAASLVAESLQKNQKNNITFTSAASDTYDEIKKKLGVSGVINSILTRSSGFAIPKLRSKRF